LTAARHGRLPTGWDTELSVEAEYRGWELTRVRLYTDGSRRVLLRRKKSRAERADSTRPDQPGL
jgi:hypothetical protein